MKITHLVSVLGVCVLLSACDGSPTAPSTPPASLPSATSASGATMRAGDKITIRLSGVPDGGYINEVQVPASGDVTVDLLNRSFHAVGLTPADLAAQIVAAYKSEKIYTNPIVTVIPDVSYVNVGGDVRGPTRVQYTPDSTVMSTINSCGGFTEYADRHRVRILRGQQTIIVDCVSAEKIPGTDPAVYPGDQIFVPRTPF